MYDKETGEDLSENYSNYLGAQIGYSSDEITRYTHIHFQKYTKKKRHTENPAALLFCSNNSIYASIG